MLFPRLVFRRQAVPRSRGWRPSPLALRPHSLLGLDAALLDELAHRQELQDAILHLLQVVVIFIQHLTSMGDVQIVLAQIAPRQLHQPVKIGLDHGVLGGLGGIFSMRFNSRRASFWASGGQMGLGDAALISDASASRFVGLSQFLTDGFELLAQGVVALGLVHFYRSFFGDLLANGEDFLLVGEDSDEQTHLVVDGIGFQDAFLGRPPCARCRRGDRPIGGYRSPARGRP